MDKPNRSKSTSFLYPSPIPAGATSRRSALRLMSALALVPACGSSVSETGGESAEGGGAEGGSSAGGASASGGSGAGGGASSAAWASDGTAMLSGKDYGNPFASGIGSACAVYLSSTEGPCHAPSPTRKDVSEGYPGVPTRLELLIVDTDCNPIPDAVVEIWHCDTHGVYSGDIDGDNDDFCTGGDETAATASWYRGIQTAGADGRVTFDTNFPGWYGGRTTHIHFRVTVNGQQSLVSQLFFDEDLKSDIYSNVVNYDAPGGQGYVQNASDQVIQESSLSLDDVTLATAQQSDGALLAWKAITVNG